MEKLLIIVIVGLTIFEIQGTTLAFSSDSSRKLEKKIQLTKPVVFSTTIAPLTPPTTVLTPTVTVTSTTTRPKPGPTLQLGKGIGCGIKELKSNEIVQIQSNNYGIDNYPNNDACTWKFLSTDCTLSAFCPCFDIPSSFDCLGDYLKILDLPHYHQKFCGNSKPIGTYRASTDLLSIRFRSDKRKTGQGFTCFVQCTPPGTAEQITPTITCPDGTTPPVNTN